MHDLAKSEVLAVECDGGIDVVDDVAHADRAHADLRAGAACRRQAMGDGGVEEVPSISRVMMIGATAPHWIERSVTCNRGTVCAVHAQGMRLCLALLCVLVDRDPASREEGR